MVLFIFIFIDIFRCILKHGKHFQYKKITDSLTPKNRRTHTLDKLTITLCVSVLKVGCGRYTQVYLLSLYSTNFIMPVDMYKRNKKY